MPIANTWLDQIIEPALEPELPIVDPHHHLWDYSTGRYLAEELLADTGSGHNVVATVFVECGSMYRPHGPDGLRPVGETEFVQALAKQTTAKRSSADAGTSQTRIAAGIVGHADLLLGAQVREVLEAHLAASPDRFRGIRHAAGWHESDEIRNSHGNPPAGLLLDKRFRSGFAELQPLGLTFDAWLYHPQLAELADLARTFPQTTIVLDHFGGPLGMGPYAGKGDAVFAAWRESIGEVAACPNVVAKLGGLNMAVNGFGWHKRELPPTSQELAAATQRYFVYAIERFGVQRCMFESNFPVDKVSCSYGVVWNAFKRIAAKFSPAEKAALFHDTATRVYRL